MLKGTRQELILEALRRDGRVQASELAARLGVSDDTVRRDLSELAEAGLVQRVHGGALPTSPALPAFADRERQAPEAKRAIARAAAALVRDGQAVFLDGGTTARLVARHLPPERRATVITHSPPTAEALMEHPSVDVLLLGGRVLKLSRAAVGAATVEAVRAIRADLYFLGVNGLHPELGISTHDLEEAHVKRAMIESAAETVALVSSEKLGTAGRYTVAPASELTHLITERAAPDDLVAPFESLGITVVRA
jgi:DeoR/GlpR family transcriptional regulator of sugar metabolism